MTEPDAPAHSMSSARGRKRLRGDDPSSSDVRPVNGPVGGTSAGDDLDCKLRTLARILSKKIKTGQRKREEREGKQGYVDPNNYSHTIYQCMQQITDKSFDGYLDRVEHALAAEVQESKIKRRAWTSWFVLSCLQLIRDRRRGGRKRLPARGAKLANLIVNRLLISEGAAAMGVYDALAEQCYKLRQASECSAEDIERLGGLVSEGLRGEIHVPLDHCWLPFPGVLLSGLFTKIPYHIICEDIGLPNLALLQFTASLSKGSVVVGFEMSAIRKEWDAFASKHLELQEIRGRYNLGDGTAAADFSHSVLSTAGEQGNIHRQTSFCEACTEYPASGRGHSGGHAGGNIMTMAIDLEEIVESGTK